MPVTFIEMANNCLKLYQALLRDPFYLKDGEVAKNPMPKDADIPKLLEGYFIFAVVWSVGVTGDTKAHETFDAFFRTVLYNKGADDENYQLFVTKNPMRVPGYSTPEGADSPFTNPIAEEDAEKMMATVPMLMLAPSALLQTIW